MMTTKKMYHAVADTADHMTRALNEIAEELGPVHELHVVRLHKDRMLVFGRIPPSLMERPTQQPYGLPPGVQVATPEDLMRMLAGGKPESAPAPAAPAAYAPTSTPTSATQPLSPEAKALRWKLMGAYGDFAEGSNFGAPNLHGLLKNNARAAAATLDAGEKGHAHQVIQTLREEHQRKNGHPGTCPYEEWLKALEEAVKGTVQLPAGGVTHGGRRGRAG